jgi:peptidoglycan/xylan/chitin deacetylase (PgdA/CDA1 family)
MNNLLDRIAAEVSRFVPVAPLVSALTAPVASLTFDDIPHSAARIGAPILEAAGVKGTFYVCGGHTARTFEEREQHQREDLLALHTRGHEIACHTFAHPRVTRLDDAARAADAAQNAAFLCDLLGPINLDSFAYPFGAMSPSAKAFYGKRFQTCRGVYDGINAGQMDFADLRAFKLNPARDDAAWVADIIAQAQARNGWLILYTHDVDAHPTPWGCKPDQLARLIEALQVAGITIETVRDAATKVRGEPVVRAAA